MNHMSLLIIAYFQRGQSRYIPTIVEAYTADDRLSAINWRIGVAGSFAEEDV